MFAIIVFPKRLGLVIQICVFPTSKNGNNSDNNFVLSTKYGFIVSFLYNTYEVELFRYLPMISPPFMKIYVILNLCSLLYIYLILFYTFCSYSFISMILDYFITLPILRQSKSHCRLETILIKMLNGNDFFIQVCKLNVYFVRNFLNNLVLMLQFILYADLLISKST